MAQARLKLKAPFACRRALRGVFFGYRGSYKGSSKGYDNGSLKGEKGRLCGGGGGVFWDRVSGLGW